MSNQAQQKKIVTPTMTELAERNRALGAKLEDSTNARNYLWNVISGQEGLPVMEFSPDPTQVLDPAAYADRRARIPMTLLPQNDNEAILYAALAHQAEEAFRTWEDIAENAKQALVLIQQLKKAQEEQMRPTAPLPEAPATIPLPQREVNDGEPQEVPRAWPGRPDRSA